MPKYDLIVIGAGSAGSSCAEKANHSGLRVALIERDALGGTCLNYGCDPTKAALHSAMILHRAKQGQQYGLNIPEAAVDWLDFKAHITAVLEKIRGGTESEARQKMQERGIDLFIGTAAFLSDKEITVDGQTLQADHFLIATGMEPAVPDVPGLVDSGFITNRDVFELDFLPEKLAIMGGGPIGVEFAQLFARLGTEVHLFEPEPHILPKDEPELAAELANVLETEGVKIHIQALVTAVSTTEEGKKLTIAYESGYEEETVFDELLLAAGRKRSIGELNLEKAGVKVKDDQIQTDKALRTNIPHIWAAGDVSADFPFTHVAWRQAVHVADNIIEGKARPFSADPIPWVTYTDPELAHVGQTEAELKAADIAYRAVDLSMEKAARAVVTGQTNGRIKLLVGDDDKILGGHILAANGGELIGPIILAMQAGISVDSLSDTVWPYPTMSEIVGKAANKL